MYSVVCPVAKTALQWPEAFALRGRSRIVSYLEYDLSVRRTAGILLYYGVSRGDHVAILMDRGFDYPVLLWALIRVGAVVCPISTRLPILSVLAALSQLDCKTIITDRDLLSHTDSLGVTALHPQALTMAEENVRPHTATEVIADRPATIMSTSGSSGAPKAVVHSFANHYYNALGSNGNIAFGAGDIWVLSLPLYHVGGLGILFRAALNGGAFWIPESGESLEESLTSSHATHLSVVPTQLYRLLEDDALGESILSNLKAVLIGGAPIPASLLDRALARGLPIHCSYGLTETASQVTATSPRATREELLTAGHPLEYRELRISDDNEILVRGATLCLGYWRDRSIVPITDSNGWFPTGDSGHLDEHDNLSVTGRRDSMFISGGENIYPEEIESALLNLPNVQQAIVVPVPSAEFGYRPIALVQMREDSAIDPASLAKQLRRALPGFKIPVKFLPWHAEQDGPGMKPSRDSLAQVAATLVELDCGDSG